MAWSMPEGCVLGIFGKKPEPGQVKTRLAVELGDEAASQVHEAMLFDVLETWSSRRSWRRAAGGSSSIRRPMQVPGSTPACPSALPFSRRSRVIWAAGCTVSSRASSRMAQRGSC